MNSDLLEVIVKKIVPSKQALFGKILGIHLPVPQKILAMESLSKLPLRDFNGARYRAFSSGAIDDYVNAIPSHLMAELFENGNVYSGSPCAT